MEGGDSYPQQALVTLVAQQYRKLRRGPYGIDQALQKATQANENSTQRIILNKSEAAWRAYYAASKASASQHGFSGKAELIRLLDELSTQPIEYQRDFAVRLASEMDRGEVDGSPRGTKRLRTTADNYSTASVSLPITSNGADTHSIDLELYQNECMTKESRKKDVYVGAPLMLAEELFQDQFWDSIQRIPSKEPGTWLADISMLFQEGHALDHFGCQMEIGIVEEKVANLASEYFGVRMESKDGIRSVRYPEGGKIEPDPSIKLRACKQDVLGLFRGDLFAAVCTSPIYQREQTERRNRTDAVSMTLSNQAKEGGKLTIFLGEWKASTIKKKLYS